MSIINNANAGSSLVVITQIDRTLREKKKPVSLDELSKVMRPDELPKTENARQKWEQNFKFWLKAGLWQSENGMVSLRSDDEKLSLSTRLGNLLFQISSVLDDEDIIASSGDYEPLLRGLACLLALDEYTIYGGKLMTKDEGHISINKFLAGRGLNLTNEMQTFFKFADFLGFVERSVCGQGFVVDPTRAIEWRLNKIFEDTERLSAKEFVRRSAQIIPVLDGGRVRNLVELVMSEGGWRGREENEMSASMCVALFRLESTSRLAFEHRSDDADTLRLFKRNGEQVPVSHITHMGRGQF